MKNQYAVYQINSKTGEARTRPVKSVPTLGEAEQTLLSLNGQNGKEHIIQDRSNGNWLTSTSLESISPTDAMKEAWILCRRGSAKDIKEGLDMVYSKYPCKSKPIPSPEGNPSHNKMRRAWVLVNDGKFNNIKAALDHVYGEKESKNGR